jgi:hypothetical protein
MYQEEITMKNPTTNEATELQNKAQEKTNTATETEITDCELETVAGGIGTTTIGMRALVASNRNEWG